MIQAISKFPLLFLIILKTGFMLFNAGSETGKGMNPFGLKPEPVTDIVCLPDQGKNSLGKCSSRCKLDCLAADILLIKPASADKIPTLVTPVSNIQQLFFAGNRTTIDKLLLPRVQLEQCILNLLFFCQELLLLLVKDL